jgi:hypothetical protein
MAVLSRHCSTHAFDWPSRKIAAWRVNTLPLFPSTEAKCNGQAQRPGRAQRRRGIPRLQQSNSRARRIKPSRAQRPGRALRSRGFGNLPRLRQSNSHACRKRPSRAQRPGRAQRKRGVRESPLFAALQLAHAPKKPSAATTRAQRKKNALRL